MGYLFSMSEQEDFLSALDVSVSPRDIEKWRDEQETLRVKLKDLQNEIAGLDQRINTATALFALMSGRTQLAQTKISALSPAPSSGPSVRKEGAPDSIIAAVRSMIVSEGKITRAHLRERLLDEAVGERLRKSDKGFYHATSRLAQSGEVVRHNGWLFSREAFNEFKSKLNAGEVVDEPAPSSTRSPVADEVRRFIAENRGVQSKDIIAHLSTKPEFNEAIARNSTSAYNVISRLVTRKEILKRDGKFYPPEAGAEEPLPDDVGSGPEASEGGTPW